MKHGSLERSRQIVALLLHAVIVVDTVVIASIGIVYGASGGQVGDGIIGIGYFKPYTMDSNILTACSSLVLMFFGARNLIQGKDDIPAWAIVLQLMGTASLSLTFLVAALFLGPMEVLGGKSYFLMFRNDMFFFHLVNPLLAIVCFTRLQPHYRFSFKVSLLGLIPTILYSIVYVVMVAVVGCWRDFYGFTFGGRYELIPIVLIVIYALILGLSLVLTRAHNRVVS